MKQKLITWQPLKLGKQVAFVFMVLCLYSMPFSSSASDALIFNDNSLTFQQGDRYKVGDNNKEIWTLEHLSVWNWGDVFFFYDHLIEQGNDHSGYYYEVAPRLSLSNLTGNSFAAGPVKDLFLATTYERGSDGFNAWLLGASLDWDIPGFAFLSTSTYYRDTEGLAGDTWQATIVWNIPFTVGALDFQLDGYTDIRGNEGRSKGDVNFNPQLKVDLGALLGFPKILYGGVEYSHWDNKFGIEGVDERNVSGLLQVKFAL
jgi:nucleoside-specific outer membrane channel protein Tsx